MVTLQTVDFTQVVWHFLTLYGLLAPKIKSAMDRWLSEGAALEDMVREWAKEAQTPEEVGLVHFLSAALHLRESEPEAAMEACRRARQGWPEISPVVHFLEAHAMIALGRYDEAFTAFRESTEFLHPLFEAMKDTLPLPSLIGEMARDFYKRWVLVGIVQALDGLAQSTSTELESGLRKTVAVLREARALGLEDPVRVVVAMIEKQLPPESQPHINALRTAVRLATLEKEPWPPSTLARIYATPTTPVQGITSGELLARLGDLHTPGEGFADDLEAIQASQPRGEPPPWDS